MPSTPLITLKEDCSITALLRHQSRLSKFLKLKHVSHSLQSFSPYKGLKMVEKQGRRRSHGHSKRTKQKENGELASLAQFMYCMRYSLWCHWSDTLVASCSSRAATPKT
jgi:hypothetical protein